MKALFLGLAVVLAVGLILLLAEIVFVFRQRLYRWLGGSSSCTCAALLLGDRTSGAASSSSLALDHISGGNNNNGNTSMRSMPMSMAVPLRSCDQDPRLLEKLFPLSTLDSYVGGEGGVPPRAMPLFTIKEDLASVESGPLPPRNQWRYAYSIGLLPPTKPPTKSPTPMPMPLLLQPPSPCPQPMRRGDLSASVSASASASASVSVSAGDTSGSRRSGSWSWAWRDDSDGTAFATPLSSPSQFRKASPSTSSAASLADPAERAAEV